MPAALTIQFTNLHDGQPYLITLTVCADCLGPEIGRLLAGDGKGEYGLGALALHVERVPQPMIQGPSITGNGTS
ncbi:MAG TPA: hypothetical protein VN524_13375 [Hyphomicrobiaceae bacterium]|nr:hypothetical protein [Hyphomicrobiaceae bacterium]